VSTSDGPRASPSTAHSVLPSKGPNRSLSGVPSVVPSGALPLATLPVIILALRPACLPARLSLPVLFLVRCPVGRLVLLRVLVARALLYYFSSVTYAVHLGILSRPKWIDYAPVIQI
jgi:hypothetical protein